MVIRNVQRKGQTLTAPDGELFTLDPVTGEAEVGDGCGLIGMGGESLVPGYVLVSGTPEVFLTETAEVVAPDGPLHIWTGRANTAVVAPDGKGTLVRFDGQGHGIAPSNCGLDAVPGYQLGPAVGVPEGDGNPGKGRTKQKPAAATPAASLAPPAATPAEETASPAPAVSAEAAALAAAAAAEAE